MFVHIYICKPLAYTPEVFTCTDTYPYVCVTCTQAYCEAHMLQSEVDAARQALYAIALLLMFCLSFFIS